MKVLSGRIDENGRIALLIAGDAGGVISISQRYSGNVVTAKVDLSECVDDADLKVRPVSGGGDDGKPRWEVSLCPLVNCPLHAVSIHSGEGKQMRIGKRYHLSNLFPTGDDEFEAAFHHQRSRISDVGTLVFMIRQMLKFRARKPENRAMLSVLFGYRAIESGCNSMMDEALGYISVAKTELPDMPRTVDIRTNGTHLGYSLATIEYHILLYRADFDELFKRIEAKVPEIVTLKKAMPATSIPVCRLLLLHGIGLVARGRESEAMEALGQCVDYYKQSVVRATTSPTFFRELMDPHYCAYLALRLRHLRHKKYVPVKVHELATALVRFGEGAARDRLVENLQIIMDRFNRAAELSAP